MIRDNEILLLDVGGTFIKCSDGRSIPIDSAGSREDIVSSLRTAVGNAGRYGHVSVAIPGPFDYDNGVFLMKHKFAAVYGEKFADIVGNPDGDFRFIHDINCMLLGELASGEGRGCSNVAMVSLGTGLGFSMCVGGQILRNDCGSPAVSIYNRPFRDGVLEDYASKRGVSSTYERISGKKAPATVKDIADMAAGGDRDALDAFEEVGRAIGGSIAPILKEYDIQRLLFGGQISRSFRFMEKSVNCALKDVPSLEKVCTISDFDNATFNGLKAL